MFFLTNGPSAAERVPGLAGVCKAADSPATAQYPIAFDFTEVTEPRRRAGAVRAGQDRWSRYCQAAAGAAATVTSPGVKWSRQRPHSRCRRRSGPAVTFTVTATAQPCMLLTCPLGRGRGRAQGRGQYILLARAINNTPFQKKKRERYSCPVPRVPMATIRPRSNAKIQQLLW